MDTVYRPNEPRMTAAAAGGSDSDGSALAALREQSRSLVAAADRVIDRVLATDRGQYMDSRRQRGGQ